MIKTENAIGKIIVETAFEIHQRMGTGLLESVYEIVLCERLRQRGLQVERQVPVPIEFDGIRIETGFRADLLVENKVIIELKSLEFLNNAHKKQLLTYLKLSERKLGYLINFGDPYFKNALIRTVNGLDEEKSSREKR